MRSGCGTSARFRALRPVANSVISLRKDTGNIRNYLPLFLGIVYFLNGSKPAFNSKGNNKVTIEKVPQGNNMDNNTGSFLKY